LQKEHDFDDPRIRDLILETIHHPNTGNI